MDFRSSAVFPWGCKRWKAKDRHWQTSRAGWDELKGFPGWIGSISCQQVFQASAWTLNVPNSTLVLVFREVLTRPAEPEEGLKIDEGSQNQFIAPELLACVMSGKIVFAALPHRSSWSWHSAQVFNNQGWIVYPFFFPLPHSRTNSLWIGAGLPVGSLIFWCEIWWNACWIRRSRISTDLHILPDFKIDKGPARLAIADNTWMILNKFSLLPLCWTTSVWREHEAYQFSPSGEI